MVAKDDGPFIPAFISTNSLFINKSALDRVLFNVTFFSNLFLRILYAKYCEIISGMLERRGIKCFEIVLSLLKVNTAILYSLYFDQRLSTSLS